MKIAVDNQISNKTIKYLSNNGFDVIRMAGHDRDEDWVLDALKYGAQIIISPDLDIPNLLDHYNSDCVWIDLPRGVGGKNQPEHILKLLRDTVKRMSK